MKKIIFLLIIMTAISLLAQPIHSTDLPINPDHIGQHGGAGQDAITARRGVDLFSEAASEVSEVVVRQREQSRADTTDSLFGAPSEQSPIDVEAETLQAAQDAQLFAQPVRFGSGMPATDESEIPFWVVAVVLLSATGIGLAIAVTLSAKRKEKAENVHNSNN